MLTILFDGIAYGMLLFVVACGLAVTLGLMNFVNLAHGAFAMAGGYITVVLVNRLGYTEARYALHLPLQREGEGPFEGRRSASQPYFLILPGSLTALKVSNSTL